MKQARQTSHAFRKLAGVAKSGYISIEKRVEERFELRDCNRIAAETVGLLPFGNPCVFYRFAVPIEAEFEVVGKD